jgi:hypothetical protein
MSRAARNTGMEAKARELVHAGEDADRKVFEREQAEAKARNQELERIGAHDRILWLGKVQVGLDKFYPITDGRIELLVNQCHALIGAMSRDVCQPPHHEYDHRDKEKLELLIHRIERHVERKPKSKGGRDRAEKLKVAAAEWQTPIEPEVRRLLKAGMTDFGIAGRLYNEAGRATGTVEKFVAKVRRNMLKK